MSATTRRRPSSSYGRDSRQGTRQSSRGGDEYRQQHSRGYGGGDKSPAQRRADKVESHSVNTERHIVRAVAAGSRDARSRDTGSRQSRQRSAGRKAKSSVPAAGDTDLLSANTSSVTQRMGRLGVDRSVSPANRSPMLQASMDSTGGWPQDHSPRIRHGPPLSPKEIRDSERGKLASMKRHLDPLPRRPH